MKTSVEKVTSSNKAPVAKKDGQDGEEYKGDGKQQGEVKPDGTQEANGGHGREADEEVAPLSPARRVSESTAETETPNSSSSEQYRDFYLNSTAEIKLTLGTPPPKRKGPRGGVASAFPVKLHAMLSRAHIEGTEPIVSWQPHGRAFTVHQPTVFVEELMPRYFKQSKMTSFQRQLNLYGFARKTDGTDRGAYYHELFLRGRPDLAKIMVRTRVKGECKRRVMAEPDFYKMPYCPEDPDPREQPDQTTSIYESRYNPPDLFEDSLARSPRAGYTTSFFGGGYGGAPLKEGGDYDNEDVPVEVTPNTTRNPVNNYMTAAALPSSSFFLDDEPFLLAPEDSEWTPPPFPELHRASPQHRERPSQHVIQPSYFPNMVSPSPEEHRPSRRMMVHRPRYYGREDDHNRRMFRESPPREHHSREPRWAPEAERKPPAHRGLHPGQPRYPPPSRGRIRRQVPSRGSNGEQPPRGANLYFEGQNFQPVDETSLEMFESSIQL